MTQPEYITKDIAAQRLNLSPRRCLELATEGKIRQMDAYNEQTKRHQTVLMAEDVDRLVQERSTPQPTELATRAPAGVAAPVTVDVPAVLRYKDVPPCAFLTLEEAGAYTGLPAAWMLARIRSGKLAALDVGVRAGGRFRVRRADLDNIQGELIAESAAPAAR